MNWLDITVLLCATAATAWLVYYVHWYLPEQLENRFSESLKAFSTAIELRFPTYAGISQRVFGLSAAVGSRMGLKTSELRDLQMAATLRDIGLCAIPYGLINGRAEEDWTAAERMTYERHPEVSGAMLELVPSLSNLAPIVRWHHANYEDLSSIVTQAPAGNDLPTEARVLKVVTEYIWLERTRGDFLARESIREGKGTVYCPLSAEALLAVLTSARAGDSKQAVTTSRS